MTQITPVADYLAAWQAEMKAVEAGFEEFFRCYSEVLLATAGKNRSEVCRHLNASCVYNAMARQSFDDGRFDDAGKYITAAYGSLQKSLWVS